MTDLFACGKKGRVSERRVGKKAEQSKAAIG